MAVHSIDAYSSCDGIIGECPLVVSVAACHQGQSKAGVDHGWIGALTDPRISQATFVDFRDTRKFDRCPVRGSVLLSRNIDIALASAEAEHNVLVPMLTLGGDHTVSIGTILSSRRQVNNTRVIWVDAHPDINTPCTTLSGNCHGMPVAHLFNYVDGFTVPNPLQPHEIVYIGLRSIDAAEQVRLDALAERGALIYHASDVLDRGMASILAEVDAAWSDSVAPDSRFNFPIHISLDVDSMDPMFTPATGTPVPGGITPSDVASLLRWANSRAQYGLTHLDVVEVNCYLATVSGAAKTVNSVQHVVNAWLSTHTVLRSSSSPMAAIADLNQWPVKTASDPAQAVLTADRRKRRHMDSSTEEAVCTPSLDGSESMAYAAAEAEETTEAITLTMHGVNVGFRPVESDEARSA